MTLCGYAKSLKYLVPLHLRDATESDGSVAEKVIGYSYDHPIDTTNSDSTFRGT